MRCSDMCVHQGTVRLINKHWCLTLISYIGTFEIDSYSEKFNTPLLNYNIFELCKNIMHYHIIHNPFGIMQRSPNASFPSSFQTQPGPTQAHPALRLKLEVRETVG